MFIVKNANKPWVAALVGHSRSASVIDSREEKHIPTFDERVYAPADFCKHHTFFDIVSRKPVCRSAPAARDERVHTTTGVAHSLLRKGLHAFELCGLHMRAVRSRRDTSEPVDIFLAPPGIGPA